MDMISTECGSWVFRTGSFVWEPCGEGFMEGLRPEDVEYGDPSSWRELSHVKIVACGGEMRSPTAEEYRAAQDDE